jgi:hypothetical protein
MSCRAANVDEGVLTALAGGGLRHVFVRLETGADAARAPNGTGGPPTHLDADQNARAVRVITSLGLSFQPGFMPAGDRATLAQMRANLDVLAGIGALTPVTIASALDAGEATAPGQADPRVTLAATVADLAAARFASFGALIAGLQSAVTPGWRRGVPGRTPEVARAIDSFEDLCNAGFADVVTHAVGVLDAAGPPDGSGLLTDVTAELDRVEARLSLARTLLLSAVAAEEDAIGYHTQGDVIAGPLGGPALAASGR